MDALFSTSFVEATPFGILAAVHLPPGLEDPPKAILRGLHPEEAAVAGTLRGRRRVEWVGGRLALREAAAGLGVELGAVLRGPRNEPLPPPAFSATVSHKRTLAVGLVAPASEGTLGVDLEELEPERMSILQRILRPEEERRILELPEARRWGALVTRFAIKEAIYKALHPHVNRYVGFAEAEVELDDDVGEARVGLHLVRNEGPFVVEARAERRSGFVLAQVRLRAG
ncbi:4'-phosphopantetheinyl transferase family protein [Vulgatibacter incomptus]|uniref:Enterobactin synthase component D n=1 Tax=Vulgatibacter incomptus TaxID=1391653 RepID=A0A0K1PEU1_9BACT|nr:4'-phosphopantetheinyl transferase superfamily protein [Vulgatibacter incomptus]AKU92035.1 4'-phosphopantetheinyl transferase entD [Vulgatibacter incomptus]